MWRIVAHATVPNKRSHGRVRFPLLQQTIHGLGAVSLMAIDALWIRVRVLQRKRCRVLELGDAIESVYLTVTRVAVATESTVVDIFMARGALLGKAQVTLLTRRKGLLKCRRMAGVAFQSVMFARQVKLHAGMGKLAGTRDTGKLKTPAVRNWELLAVMFGVAGCTVLSSTRRHRPVEAPP